MLYKMLPHLQRCMNSLIGEKLVYMCIREPETAMDRCTVAVIKNEEIVGHLPRKLSKVCLLFITRRDSMSYMVAGDTTHMNYPIMLMR